MACRQVSAGDGLPAREAAPPDEVSGAMGVGARQVRALALVVFAGLALGGAARGQVGGLPVVRSMRLCLEEQAKTVELDGALFGHFRLDVSADVDEPRCVDSLGVAIGDLQVQVPLERGRFTGTVDAGSGPVRVAVRAGAGRLKARIHGSLRRSTNGIFGRAYLTGCAGSAFWGGVVFGTHPVTISVGPTTIDGVVGIIGRSAWPPKPHWDYANFDENEVASVRLRGSAVFPAVPEAGPVLVMVPERAASPWSGRVRGCALSVGTAAAVSIARADGTRRSLSPINAEALGLGSSRAVAPGILEFDFYGTPVYQVLFDSAVPEAIVPGRWRVIAEAAAGVPAERTKRVQGPAPTNTTGVDVYSQVLEVRDDGAVWGWSSNFDGELGIGNKLEPARPARALLPVSASEVSAGYGFSVALDEAGQVWQWGKMSISRLESGQGPFEFKDVYSNTPTLMTGFPKFTMVSAGGFHALGLDGAGRVWAWGENELGQLGDGTLIDRPRRPNLVQGLPTASWVAAGHEYSVALDTEGRVWAWGDYKSQYVPGPTAPTLVQGLPLAKSLSARVVCLVLGVDGTVWGWGPNLFGEVGDGTRMRREDPVQVVGLGNVISVDAGVFHCAAVRADGTVWTWGDNAEGQLGDGTSVDRLAPVQVRDLEGIIAVGAGSFRTLAIDGNGCLWGWGSVSPLRSSVIGLQRGGSGIYPQLLPRVGDGAFIKY